MTRILKQSAFTLIELLALIVVLLLLTYFAVPSADSSKRKHAGIKCFNNLNTVGVAARIYATDNNGLMPGAILLSNKVQSASIDAAACFRMFSNELSTPNIIFCPADSRAQEATSFTNLTSTNISYFLSLSAHPSLPKAFLAGDRNIQVPNGEGTIPPGLFSLTTNLQLSWSKEIHNGQGNIAMMDGSVQTFKSARLTRYLREQALSTNLLVFP
jgi:prepilin-type processing-associated H-X9-DG protein